MFLVRHIDSVIQMLVGAALTWAAYRSASKLRPPARTILRVCGPLLIVVGGLLLLKPSRGPSWQRQLTSDKGASAEFPGAATSQESADTLGGITVRRTSFTYDVPGRDISLFLSYSALPENTRTMTDAQRIEGTLAYFVSQGAKVVQNETDAGGAIHRVTIRQDDKKSTTRMALAYAGDNVYRVVASWTDGQEDESLTDRFINSFRLSSAEPSGAH